MTAELTLVKTYSSARARIFAAGIKKQREIEARQRQREIDEAKAAEAERRRREFGWMDDLKKWAADQRKEKLEAEQQTNERQNNKLEAMEKWREDLRKWGLEQQRIEIEEECRRQALEEAQIQAEIEARFPMPQGFVKRPIGEITREILAKHNDVYTIHDILSPRRERKLVAVRHEIYWEVYRQRPDMSIPQIGRKFMRDHTSILHAVQKYKRMIAEQELEAAE